jgi:subtilisin family serine protease
MSSFFQLLNLRAIAIATSAALLVACGGGENLSTSGSASSGALSKAATPYDPLVVERNEPAEKAARQAYEAKNGTVGLSPQAAKQTYHSTRVLARLLDTDTNTASAQKLSNKLSILGLRQISGFTNPASKSGLNKTNLAGGRSSNSMAVFEITQAGLTVPEAVEQLQRSGLVAYAEPDYNLQRSLAPNDPNYGIFWHLKNTGQASGVVGTDINAEAAWNTATGNGTVVVAVIDDGIKYDHPDLAANMWTSAGTPRVTIPGDSINGQVVDDANGANLAFDRTAADTSLLPYNREESDHGTMVAGFVGASGNNAVGGSGVAWNVKIMGIKIEGPSPNYSLSTSSFVNAIRYALAKKAAGVNMKVINISYGGYFPSQAYKEAIEEANAQGVLVIVAAGNDGSNDERVVGYPSNFKTPNLISVGALNRSNARANFSNYGRLVHLFAPGEDVPTTSSRASLATNATRMYAPYYRYIDGTSFASPIVAGAAALLWMQYPSETAAQIKARLLHGTSPFLTTEESLTGGKLNLATSIAPVVSCTTSAPVLSELTTQVVKGGTHKISAYIKQCPTVGDVSVLVDGVVSAQIKDDGVYPDEYAGDGYYSGTFVGPASTSSSTNISVRYQDTVSSTQYLVSKSASLKAATSYVGSAASTIWRTPVNVVNWNNIVGNYDEGSVPVSALAFPIRFDGRTVNSVFMSTNGYLCLDDQSCFSSLVSPLPSGNSYKPLGTTQAMIAPWWNDWTADCTTSDMYYDVVGAAPNRRIVFTWKNLLAYYSGFSCTNANTNGVSFQVVFYEGQDYYDFVYNDVVTITPTGNTSASFGGTGSGGVQLSGGKLGTQLFYKGSGSPTNTRYAPRSPSFTDVLTTDFFATSVEGLRGARITVGCNPEATLFCADFNRGRPDAEIKTTQQQMAAFLARGINGHDLLFDYTPYPSSGFTDVFSTFTKYVNYLKTKGIMTGTGPTPTQFCNGDCNTDFVTRAQMARYLVKAVRGGSFVPPAATGVFSDVPASHPEAPYIEEVARMKITLGIGNNQYGPDNVVTRGQMATFLQRTFRPFDPH